jgi:NAD(P)-dependent dehydrogenase (short-subunit alcohol dehydrogenase family)
VTTDSRDLRGRRAFVSGSTHGVGRAIAVGRAAAGATVTVSGRTAVVVGGVDSVVL